MDTGADRESEEKVMDTVSGIKINVENLIDDFGIALKFYDDRDKNNPPKIFYIKLTEEEAKDLARTIQGKTMRYQ
jgi:hypothetical protein